MTLDFKRSSYSWFAIILSLEMKDQLLFRNKNSYFGYVRYGTTFLGLY